MSPSTNGRMINTKFNVKRFFGKILASKENVKRDKVEDILVCDSLPDYVGNDREKLYSNARGSEGLNNTQNDNSWRSSQVFDEGDTEKEESKWEQKKEKSKQKWGSESDPTETDDDEKANNVYNFKHVTNVQIGNTYKQSFTQIYNGGLSQKEEKKHVKLTPQIEEFLKSNAKLDARHIQCLSNHFGDSWRKIGLKLDFTNGELDIFHQLCKNDLQEISFQVLNRWAQKEGEMATVGKLCTKLWNSGIGNAQEAVKKLSKKKNLLNK